MKKLTLSVFLGLLVAFTQAQEKVFYYDDCLNHDFLKIFRISKINLFNLFNLAKIIVQDNKNKYSICKINL
jgi:hypothetical protein